MEVSEGQNEKVELIDSETNAVQDSMSKTINLDENVKQPQSKEIEMEDRNNVVLDHDKRLEDSTDEGTAEITSILESYQQMSRFDNEKNLSSKFTKTVTDSTTYKKDYNIGIDNIVKQREKILAEKGINFTIMVAGQYGLGKTTFINTLFGTTVIPSLNRRHIINNEQPSTPTKLLSVHKANLLGNNSKYNLTIIDTPGFGSRLNNAFNWTPLTNHIDEQIRSHIFQEEQPDRTQMKDEKVHCCIYFIDPINKGLTTLDVVTMKELSKRVNLIPVIAKADTLTKTELNEFKNVIREILEIQNITVCQFLDSKDPYYQDFFKNIPFSIISSDKRIKNSKGEVVYGRSYNWGQVEVENPQHSDFIMLREFLFDKYLTDLVYHTDEYYETCRTTLLKTRLLKGREVVQNQSTAMTGEVEISNELKEILKTFNFEDLDSNGIKNYICYQLFNKKYIDSLVLEWSQEYVHKQWETKKKFNDVVAIEENKFQEWRKAILQKQEQFNNEINDLHSQIESLQLECQQLEATGLSRDGFDKHNHGLLT